MDNENCTTGNGSGNSSKGGGVVSRHHSVKQILLLLLAVLLLSVVIIRVLQSTNNLHYMWIGLSVTMVGYMVNVKRGPVTMLITGLVYVRAVGMVAGKAVVEGGMVVRRDWGLCVWRAKQLT